MYATVRSSPFVPGARPSYSSEASTFTCAITASAVKVGTPAGGVALCAVSCGALTSEREQKADESNRH